MTYQMCVRVAVVGALVLSNAWLSASQTAAPLDWCIQPSTLRISQGSLCSTPDIARSSKRVIDWHAMRGERESAQLVLTNPPASLASLTFSDLTSSTGAQISSGALSYKQVMYVFCRNSTMEQTHVPKWYADPLMAPSDQGTISIEEGSTQPIWISVDVPRNAHPGVYEGQANLVLSGAGSSKVVIGVPIMLEVWNLTVPTLANSTFSMVFAMRPIPGQYTNESEAVVQQYLDMLTSYRMPPDSMYRIAPIDDVDADYLVNTGAQWFNMLNVEYIIRTLQENGQPDMDMVQHRQYGLYRQSRRMGQVEDRECPVHANVSDAVMQKLISLLAPVVSRAYLKGYINRTYVYGFDEAPTSCLAAIHRVFGAIKDKWPQLRTMAALDWQTMPLDIPLDIWVFLYRFWDPYPSNTVPAAAEAFVKSQPSRHIFFYHCIDPASSAQLNSFVDRPLIETRLMFWDGAVTSPPISGWLYYSVNEWRMTNGSTQFVTHINGSARSNFNVARVFGNSIGNGDGFIIYPGVDGPIASLRLEQFSDASEDVELLRLIPADLALPLINKLVRASNDFSIDPVLFASVRQQVAKLAMSR